MGSSYSHKQKQKTPSNKEKQTLNKRTLANIVAKNENEEYVSKNYPVHIYYIEQKDYHLIDNPWQ